MAEFPGAIYAPRTIANRPGVVYDADDQKTFFAEDLNNANAEIVAIETNFPLAGWLALATIPTLQSSDDPNYVLRFGADMTAILALGQKIKVTQHGAVKYFIVVAIGAFTGGNTDVTVYGGTDYDMENTTTYPVTLPCFSMQKAPFGFPLNPIKWTVVVTDNADRTRASPTANVWYNLGSVSISAPIGIWRAILKVVAYANISGTGVTVFVTLSTANNSESNSKMTGYTILGAGSAALSIAQTQHIEDVLVMTAKTTHYLNTKTGHSGIGSLYNLNGQSVPAIIRLVCAYL